MRRTSPGGLDMLPCRQCVLFAALIALVSGCAEDPGESSRVYSLPTPERHRWPSKEEIRRRTIEIVAENKERAAKELLTGQERRRIDRVGGPVVSQGYGGPQADTNRLGRYQPYPSPAPRQW